MVLESKSEAAFCCWGKGRRAGREEIGELGICTLQNLKKKKAYPPGRGSSFKGILPFSHMNPQAPVGTCSNSVWEGFRAKSFAFSSGQMVFHWASHLQTEREPLPPDLQQHLLHLLTVPENGKAIYLHSFYRRLSTAQKGAAQTRAAQLLRSYLPGLPLPLVSDFILQCIAQPLASISCFPGQQEVS